MAPEPREDASRAAASGRCRPCHRRSRWCHWPTTRSTSPSVTVLTPRWRSAGPRACADRRPSAPRLYTQTAPVACVVLGAADERVLSVRRQSHRCAEEARVVAAGATAGCDPRRRSCSTSCPIRVNTQAAPAALPASAPGRSGPPTSAVLPSDDSATLVPKWSPAPGLAPVAVSFCCSMYVEPERTYTHAAPLPPSTWSRSPPISAVVPSADSATLLPNSEPPPRLVGGDDLLHLWLHTPSERVNTQRLRRCELSSNAPMIAVLPSAESATLLPNGAAVHRWSRTSLRHQLRALLDERVDRDRVARAAVVDADDARLPWLTLRALGR